MMGMNDNATVPATGAPACETPVLGNYLMNDHPDPDKWADCVHCGMCLESCPTYLETGQEHQSPRGRVYLIKAVADGKINLDEQFEDPVFTCLDCRACETACPSNVQVGSLIEAARGQVRQAMPLTGFKGAVSKLFLDGIFPNPKRLHTLGGLLKFYQSSGLQTLVEKTGMIKVLPEHLQEMQRVTPKVNKPVLGRYPSELPAETAEKKGKVAVFTGCVMDVVFSDINESTIRVLRKNGFDVILPEEQKCCGALHVHAGDRDKGRELAKQNIEAFKDVDKIIINAAGCGAAMKEYGELFRHDPEWRERAEEFSAKVEDVSKFLVETGFRKPKAELHTRITYHDACHLAHAQGVRSEPRQILKEIPGVELVEMENSDRCCGSAGIYNMTNPDMAKAVLDKKMEYVPKDVEMISMGNPGCMLQMAMGVMRHGRDDKIVHTVQLIDWAYQKEDESSTSRETAAAKEGR